MSLDRILCLANSYKHDHRCVAGINLVTKRWVRLAGKKITGRLTVEQTCYRDGSEAALLDVFEAETGQSCASNSHPEDVLVTEKTWRPVRRFDEPRDKLFLKNLVSKRPFLLHGFGDRIYVRKFSNTPATHSLELIHPDDLWWWIREEGGKRKNRALFRHGHVIRARYDLAVTDPQWLERLRPLEAGIYPHAFFFSDKPPVTLLTVSLSEPFENFHYKLVAGVVNLPA
jgi:hypothetical protein